MSQPPYHLSPNKAVDRLLFVDVIRRFGRDTDLAEYTYYSMGGPYLEDFRLMYEFFPDMKMVSIERDTEVFKRQNFHLPCGHVTLLHTDLKTFINTYNQGDAKSIFWLDNTGLEYSHFDEFMTALQKLSAGSVIKLTLDASFRKFMTVPPDESRKRFAEFCRKFEVVMPAGVRTPPTTAKESASLLQTMVRTASERALPGTMPLMFQPLSSFYYKDTALMLTVTGVLLSRKDSDATVQLFSGWQFANVDWREPRLIDLPTLTTKERLHLQCHLPCAHDGGRVLREVLGYQTGENAAQTERQLSQYAEYHRYSPYFVRSVP